MRTATRMVVLNSKKYVLDLISAVVAAAYSLRRLYASYTGAAIRVRRSSDNAERDIGFIGEHLDVLALLVFVGNGSGFVTTWYDQSGNGRHATQTTAAKQPQIVSNGVVESQNGRPAVVFDGVNDRLATASTTLGITSSATLVVVTELSSRTRPEQGIVGSNDMTARFGFFITLTNTIRWNPVAFSTIEASSVTGAQILVGTAQSGATALFRNGTSIATGTDSTGTMSSTPFNIGNMLSGTTLPHFSGTVAEVLTSPSVLSTTDLQTLKRNQGIYFNISVS
jgi:trimeric autotransporter adhesin